MNNEIDMEPIDKSRLSHLLATLGLFAPRHNGHLRISRNADFHSSYIIQVNNTREAVAFLEGYLHGYSEAKAEVANV